MIDAADFVEGLLEDQTMSVVYGESGCGKTFFVLDLALHIALGRAWRGRDVEQGGVLYLALEGSNGIRNRIAAFKQVHELNCANIPFALVPVTVDLLHPGCDVDRSWPMHLVAKINLQARQVELGAGRCQRIGRIAEHGDAAGLAQ